MRVARYLICILLDANVKYGDIVSQPARAFTWSDAAEQAQRQAQEAEGSQQHVTEEEAKAARLAQQAEQRAKQEQSRGNLTAAVAASFNGSQVC